MSYAITDLLNDLTTVVHGTTVNKVPGVYNIINRAARSVLLDVDPKETQRIVSIGQVFNDVYDYPLPVDVKGDRIIDLRIQAGRQPWEIFTQGYSQNFDANKVLNAGSKVYTQWNTGVKTIRIEAPTLVSPIVLSDTSTLTGWSVTAGAQNLSLDTTNNVAGGGDITFDLAAGSGTGSVQISTLSPIDLTSHVNIDTIFFWVYMPLASAITSVSLKWGSDYTANYYTATATTDSQGNAFVNGWNLISLTWSTATLVGAPTATSYDSLQLTVAYDSTLQTGFKLCNVTSNTGYIFDLVYYSKYLFRNPSTNAFQETVVDSTDNSKIINLDTESYNLLFNKTAFLVAQSLQGADSSYDADFWQTEYTNALNKYKKLNLGESMLKGESYYRIPKKGYNRFGPWFRQSGT